MATVRRQQVRKRRRELAAAQRPVNRARAIPLAARRHPFVAEVARGLQRCGISLAGGGARARTHLAIGASGGADSLALVLACLVIARHHKGSALELTALHVHHHLRDSANDDARSVQELCQQFNISCRVLHVFPGRLSGNVAGNARRLRYQALGDAAATIGAGFVAVAHHGEDQLETMIAALARGAGLDGLAGMPWARGLDDSITLIRPLLGVRRADCQAFCRAARVKWRDDPGNVDATKRRARLRRDVLPVLEELFPDAARRATSAAELIRTAKAVLEKQLEQVFGPPTRATWPRQALQSLPLALIAAGLRRAAIHLAPELGDELAQRHLMQAAELIGSCDRSPHRYDWPLRMRLKVSSQVVTIARVSSPRRGGLRRKSKI